jgi:hypothetical protein
VGNRRIAGGRQAHPAPGDPGAAAREAGPRSPDHKMLCLRLSRRVMLNRVAAQVADGQRVSQNSDLTYHPLSDATYASSIA